MRKASTRCGGLLLASMLGILSVAGCHKGKPKAAPAPVAVRVVAVEPQDVPIIKEWIGTLAGYIDAEIRAQVSGYLLSQNYVEGSVVKKGPAAVRN
jgi:membrane fusion protein, multidrug efflux system